MAGIEQTEDVLQAAGAVGLFFVQAGKDGWSFADVRSALGDDHLRTKVIEGVRGSGQIPGEITDLDLQEIMSLVATAAEEFEGVA